MWIKTFVAVGSAVLILGGTWTASWVIDERYAKVVQLPPIEEKIQLVGHKIDLVGKRLDQKLLDDRVNNLDERLWRLRNKYGQTCERNREVCKNVDRALKKLQMRQFKEPKR